MRHVHGGAFVAHIDDLDTLARDMIPDGLDVAALQAEYTIDAARLEEAGNPGGGGQRVGIEVLLGGERLVHGGSFPAPPSAWRLSFCKRRRRCRIFPGGVRGFFWSLMKAT